MGTVFTVYAYTTTGIFYYFMTYSLRLKAIVRTLFVQSQGSDFKSNCGSLSYLAPEVFRDSSTSGLCALQVCKIVFVPVSSHLCVRVCIEWTL